MSARHSGNAVHFGPQRGTSAGVRGGDPLVREWIAAAIYLMIALMQHGRELALEVAPERGRKFEPGPCYSSNGAFIR